MDDEQLTSLAREFRKGDMRAFERIVNAMSRPLIAMAHRYTDEWESARDLTQETFLTVFEKIDMYDPSRAFPAWILTIHRNGCLSYIRRGAFRCEAPSENIEMSWSSTPGKSCSISSEAP